jgi:glycosyltransferase involved in cell wall biosynthesis
MTVGRPTSDPAPTLLYFVTVSWFFRSHFLGRALAARRAGWRVAVMTRCDPGDAERLAALGLDVVPLPISRSGLHPLREATTLARVIGAYRRLQPDLVHHVAMKPIVYGTIAARLTRVPAIVNAPVGLGFVFTSGSARARTLRPLLSTALRALLDPPAARVVLENADDARALVAAGWARAEHVRVVRGAGVDLARFTPTATATAGPPRIVLPARMLRDKGVGEFVAAARALLSEGVVAEFLLAGDTDPDNPSAIPEARLRAWSERPGVRWLGHVDDMPALLARCSIVCLPSYREGLPKALIEAAACGLPIVTTDVPGCRDVVRDGFDGLLVPPRDAGALARALRCLLEDPELRTEMGRTARARAVAEFGSERIEAETLAIYREITDAHGSAELDR